MFALYRDIISSDNQIQTEFVKRKGAILGDTISVQPWDKANAADVAASDTCQKLPDEQVFVTLTSWLLNATLWPVAVCEKVYKAVYGGGFRLSQIVPVPYSLLDYRDGNLRIFDTDAQGVPLPTSHIADPARYIVHRGHTLPSPDNWGGPMRSILFWWLLRTMDRQWWADLLERFGMPFLKGKYKDEAGNR